MRIKKAIAATVAIALASMTAGYAVGQSNNEVLPPCLPVYDFGPSWRTGPDRLIGYAVPEGVDRADCRPGAPTTTTTTTTTVPPTTTTVAPTTTTLPPTTTAPTTTVPATVPPTTTTTLPPLPGVQFVETFDNDTGLNNFTRHVFHRNPDVHNYNGSSGGSWQADHSITPSDGQSCGAPSTTRTMTFSANHSQAQRQANGFYVCRNHMMTTMGDVDGYSIVGFSPNEVFPSVRKVCWEVNLTNMGNRQWWKVGVVSNALFNSTKAGGRVPGWIVSDVDASDVYGSMASSDRFIASYGGGLSGGLNGGLKVGNTNTNVNYTSGTDKMTRFPSCLTDNGNGTVTFQVGPVSATRNGSFPAGPVRVIFLDQNYTPDKSEHAFQRPAYTWHWDTITVE